MSAGNKKRSLKSLNLKWLVSLVVADVLGVMFFLVPGLDTGASLAQLGIGRALFSICIPVAILLIVNVLPHDVKAMLVYWKPLGWLPGTEAFTLLGPRDPRINMQFLESKIGPLPTGPNEQNSKWYELFKQVDDETEVSEAHRHFLMYRDMAVLSLPLILLAPLVLYYAGASPSAQLVGAALFALQYLVTALSGRWSGTRFVTNVLAVHSVQKGTTRKGRYK